jgi:hypothetical protein
MRAALVVKRHQKGLLAGEIDTWWVKDELGHRWEIFSYDPPNFSIQYDTGEKCGTGIFVLDSEKDLRTGIEMPGTIFETVVGDFGVPCEVEFTYVAENTETEVPESEASR